LHEGQVSERATVEAWSRRHCQWKWQEQGRRRSSGTVWPSSPDSSGSRVSVSGSEQDLQVAIFLCVTKIGIWM